MFGIIRPCAHHGCAAVREAWVAHLCGLCLTLRDGQGHGARLATNYDTLLVSVLTEAQLPSSAPRRKAGPCALRGFRTAEVLDARGRGARLAAAVSLVLAAGRLRDDLADGDASWGGGRLGGERAKGALARRWEAAGVRMAEAVGFDPAPLTVAVGRQLVLERQVGAGRALERERAPERQADPGMVLEEGQAGAGRVLELSAPTEDAVAAAFAYTAVLAGRPGNAGALGEAGRFFGRLAYLLDACEDRAEDERRGAFNPLTATGTSPAEARRLCEDAAHGITLALAEVEFEERHVVDVLLGTEARRAVERTFRASYEKPGWARKTAGCTGTLLTCGLWRPRWSKWKQEEWDHRCFCCWCAEICGPIGQICSACG
ncbi:DUF5685 family protein [[Actinomadura] parvosata]|uniref:DUF5685 family protein n=1 Tax=[Actinomadura] parvosata TaxID=1955412 RepID=UPI0022A8516C|nr:DUF5685 family protein [Nonomuraea sp. ATCC 55076]